MKWKLWKIGVCVAFFCALADALGVYIVAETFIWGKLIAFSIIKGMGGAALYMRQHPTDQIAFDTTTISRTSTTANPETGAVKTTASVEQTKTPVETKDTYDPNKP